MLNDGRLLNRLQHNLKKMAHKARGNTQESILFPIKTIQTVRLNRDHCMFSKESCPF